MSKIPGPNGKAAHTVETGNPNIPVTEERPPYNPSQAENKRLPNPGTARVDRAATQESPEGSEGWAEQHSDQSVLQQHCDFFDTDKDGVIWPFDTFVGMRDLGFNLLLSLFAVVIINGMFSYATSPSIIPDPFFRLYQSGMHKAKHGSDTGVYDNEGRFVPQKFEDFFNKYARGKDGLSLRDLYDGLSGQRLLMDPFGASGAILEWGMTYLLLWPEDGIMKKEDVRKMYDGSLFEETAVRLGNRPPSAKKGARSQ